MTTGIGSDAIVSMEFWNSKGKGAQAQQLLAIGDDQVRAPSYFYHKAWGCALFFINTSRAGVLARDGHPT